LAHVSIPAYWKAFPQRYCLTGLKCKACGSINFPATEICTTCRRKSEFEAVKLSGRGKIFTYTIISVGGAPPEFSEQERLAGAYPSAIVELDEGVKIVAQICDCRHEDLRVGMEVEAALRKIYEEDGVIRYGVKFRPTLTTQ